MADARYSVPQHVSDDVTISRYQEPCTLDSILRNIYLFTAVLMASATH